MLRKLLAVGVLSIGLAACSAEEAAEPAEETAKEVAPPTTETEAVEEDAEEVVEPVEETSPEVAPLATEITYEDFNGRFKQDVEETQYPNGKFQLSDGSTVNADYLFYAGNDVFDYAMAIFADGKLVDVMIETPLTMVELEKALGVSLLAENVSVDTYDYGYVLNFDERFHEDNIAIYPNEWD